MNERRLSWLSVFVLGGLIGAGLALLFAPRSGKDTREKLSDLARDAADRLRNSDESSQPR
jgi:gas vesicle protein